MATDDIETRLRFLELDQDARASLKALRPMIEAELPGILDAFYDHISAWPQVAKFFGSPSHMSVARSKQLEHWMLIAGGEFNESYVQSVRRIGLAHAKLGLEPRWYIAGYAFLTTRLLAVIASRFAPKAFKRADDLAAQTRFMDAITKAVMLDMDFAISIYLEESETAKSKAMHELADQFESQVLGVVETVASAATEMAQTAKSMAETAAATSDRSSAVAAAAEQATSNVSLVAASTEEMGRSVQEIAEQVSHSTKIAGTAVERAESTNETIERLSKAAEKIGEVVSLISDIAEQTNLLALNATIESARAGEAGKGFAVVAAEVKSLATQTAKATEDIGAQIQDMQAITEQSVEAIAAIRTTIDEINIVSVSINAAVEEQSAATQEISRSTQEAASGTQEVSANIAAVLTGAQDTGAASGEVVSASEELGRQAELLRREMNTFLTTVRAA